MSNIVVIGKSCFLLKRLVKNVANEVLSVMGQPSGLEVAISFVSDDEIKRLNKDTRSIDKVTDVLSYPSLELKAGEIIDITNPELAVLVNENGLIHIGDMAISLKQAKRQAKIYKTTFVKEVKKLVIHSMLHLLGYDHIKDDDYAVMKEKEDELDKLIR